MTPAFHSIKGEIPEIDPTKFELIISLLSTFEANDLHTRNIVNFRYDETSDYVFLEILSVHNGMKLVDCIFGYDRDKLTNVCKYILEYFESRKNDKHKR